MKPPRQSGGFKLLKTGIQQPNALMVITRYPCRPNPIGLSIVMLVSKNDNWLEIEGVDVLDGTPLLDIKPYVPEFDLKKGGRASWFDTREK